MRVSASSKTWEAGNELASEHRMRTCRVKPPRPNAPSRCCGGEGVMFTRLRFADSIYNK